MLNIVHRTFYPLSIALLLSASAVMSLDLEERQVRNGHGAGLVLLTTLQR